MSKIEDGALSVWNFFILKKLLLRHVLFWATSSLTIQITNKNRHAWQKSQNEYIWLLLRGHYSFCTYEKFSKKLTFLTPWYTRTKWMIPNQFYLFYLLFLSTLTYYFLSYWWFVFKKIDSRVSREKLFF